MFQRLGRGNRHFAIERDLLRARRLEHTPLRCYGHRCPRQSLVAWYRLHNGETHPS
jgi:hypothetical protein